MHEEIEAVISADIVEKELIVAIVNRSTRTISLPDTVHYTSDLWPTGYGYLSPGAEIHLTYFDSCQPRNDNLKAFKIGEIYEGVIMWKPYSYVSLLPGDTLYYKTPFSSVVVFSEDKIPECIGVYAIYTNYWEYSDSKQAWIGSIRAQGLVDLGRKDIENIYGK